MEKNESVAALVCPHLENFLDTLSDGVYLTDKDGKTLMVNSVYERLTALGRDQLLGRNVRELVEQGIFNVIVNPEIVGLGKPVTRLQTNMHGRRVVLNGHPILDKSGEVVLVVTYVRDITTISKMRDQIADQQELIEKFNTNFAYMNKSKFQKHPLVYVSETMNRTMERLRRLATSDATVLLLGETGVGKDMMARNIYEMSDRLSRPYFKIDCSSIPENLIESELFGYAPGAFSGALSKGKIGFFEIADKGTIFLDEIGELPLAMQSKLLRVLQDMEVVRVGSTQARKVDVRIIAATNRDLLAEVQRGAFRSDLYYRLRVGVLTIPSLRERPEDIPLLAKYFLDAYSQRYRKKIALSSHVQELMKRYRWPGNVREMENLIQSLVITCERGLVESTELPTNMLDEPPCNETLPLFTGYLEGAGSRPLKQIMADIERKLIRDALALHGSVGKVARLFGVNRTTIFRKLQGEDGGPPQNGQGRDAAVDQKS
jgi:PAS domain S-box-containing protein